MIKIKDNSSVMQLGGRHSAVFRHAFLITRRLKGEEDEKTRRGRET